MARPALSVVVPTIPGRSRYLDRCLAALSACEGRDEIEVLVVSEAPAEIESLLRALEPRVAVRVVSGPAPAARKRNAGARAARADAIAFLDDDTRPEPRWVRGLLDAFRDGADALAGRVVPDFEAPLPRFLSGREDAVRGFNALGEWRRAGFVIGCNIAFRRRVFESVGLFSPDFGRRGARYHTGDESEFVRRVAREFDVRYCEEAGVVHSIQPRRLSPGYLQGRAWWAGRANAGIDELHRHAFARNVLSVALLLPVLVVRAAARVASVPDRLPAVHALSYAIEGARLLLFGRGPTTPIPRLGARPGEGAE